MFRYVDGNKRNFEPCVKAYLCRNVEVSFQQNRDGGMGGKGRSGDCRVLYLISSFDDSEPAKNFRDMILNSLTEHPRAAAGLLLGCGNAEEEKGLQLTFATASSSKVNFGSKKLRVEVKGVLLEKLRSVFGNDQLRVKVELGNARAEGLRGQTAFNFAQPFGFGDGDHHFRRGSDECRLESGQSIFGCNILSENGAHGGFGFVPPTTSETQEMKVIIKVGKHAQSGSSVSFFGNGNNSRNEIVCEDNDMEIPSGWKSNWFDNSDSTFRASLSVTVSVSNKVVAPVVPDVLVMNKKMLQDEVECDAEIVASNGAQIKCHRSFLSVHSSVLQTMFGSSFQESKTSKIEMVDMTEEGIKALLKFLYYWDIEQPTKQPQIALELFEAGHKYDISILENHMKSLLLERSNLWYEVNTAVKLFLFARNVDGCGDMVSKAVQVLKSKSQDELKASTEYQTLFAKKPEAALELCTRGLTT